MFHPFFLIVFLIVFLFPLFFSQTSSPFLKHHQISFLFSSPKSLTFYCFFFKTTIVPAETPVKINKKIIKIQNPDGLPPEPSETHFSESLLNTKCFLQTQFPFASSTKFNFSLHRHIPKIPSGHVQPRIPAQLA